MRFIITSRSRRSITPTPAANAAASMLPNNHIVSSVSPRSQYAEIETFPVVLFSISITSRLSTSYLYLCGCINHESDSFHTRLIFIIVYNIYMKTIMNTLSSNVYTTVNYCNVGSSNGHRLKLQCRLTGCSVYHRTMTGTFY